MGYAIYGIGGFGREVALAAIRFYDKNIAPVSGMSDRHPVEAHPVVFVDDDEASPNLVNGIPVLNFEKLREQPARQILVAVGNGAIRKKIEDRCLAAGLSLGRLVANSAIVPQGAKVGAGSVICDFSMITVDAIIGKSFQSNIYSYVAHDCVMGDHVTFAPRVSCNGNVHIGNGVYVGTGATIVQGTHAEPLVIGEGSIVAMGSVVTKPVEPYTLVAGNPARLVRKIDQ